MTVKINALNRNRPENVRLLQLLCIAAALLLGLFFTGVTGATETRASSAPALVFAYHVAPPSRVAFREELEQTTMRQFQRWQDDGILKGFRILFSRYADSDNWDAMALLTFPSATEVGRWKAIEQTTPAGLSQKGLALTTAIHAVPGTLLRSKSAAETPSNPVLVVIPYVSLVSASDYLKYADGYAIPQFDGAMADGAISRYDLFAGNFPAGRPWSAMIILEYKDEAALARRNVVEAKVRGKLAEIPEWKAYSDNKKGIREEKQVVTADPLNLRQGH